MYSTVSRLGEAQDKVYSQADSHDEIMVEVKDKVSWQTTCGNAIRPAICAWQTDTPNYLLMEK